MRYVGFSENFHDAGLAIVTEEGNIEFASHSERFSKYKNDPKIHQSLWNMTTHEDNFTFYEDPTLRDPEQLAKFSIDTCTRYDQCVLHHVSHAAGAMFTRPWEDASDTVMLTIDGAGEEQSACIFDSEYNLLHETTIPSSIGVAYAQATKAMGFKPLEEEYIVMGLASYGQPDYGWVELLEDAYSNGDYVEWCNEALGRLEHRDFAATVQMWAEDKIVEFAKKAREYGSKLVYSGGVAQNIKANNLIANLFDEVWIPPAVTDAGSALGAAAYTWGKETGNDRLNWEHAYLGYNLDREINPKEVVEHLLHHRVCGVANGRAEYGPRALGNRSLIADVRYDVKDTVNTIKQRQKYRPFAPAILEEYAQDYFEGPMNEYMQYTARAKHDFHSVIHVDGTSRVQLVGKDNPSIIRPILEEYYEQTGVPMLLNTSLNIRGRPIVNDELDGKLFEQKYKVKVF